MVDLCHSALSFLSFQDLLFVCKFDSTMVVVLVVVVAVGGGGGGGGGCCCCCYCRLLLHLVLSVSSLGSSSRERSLHLHGGNLNQRRVN